VKDNTALGDIGEQHRKLGREVTRIIADHASSLDGRKVTSGATVRDLVAMFDEPLPQRGIAAEEILRIFEQDVLPNGMQIPSPRYFGLFNPTPLPIAVWGDALASAINQNGAVWRNSSAANVIEARVVKWLCAMLGYEEKAFGTLTSGGSEANLVALKCARDNAHDSIRDKGIRSAPGDLIFYASEQCHYSFIKSVDILGLGREALRKIPTDDKFHIDARQLRREIARDRAEGRLICGIAGAAGATSTGIIDPLDELADIASEVGCWFHVDAAYGGALACSTAHRTKLKGIERADSITIDPHKWMFVPFACGAVLVRDGGGVLRKGFDITPEYLSEDRGGGDVEFDFFRYGQLGTTRFNALKLWMAIKLLGVEGYGKLIDRQLELTGYLASELDKLEDFERAGEVETAVCCFRFLPELVKSLGVQQQDALQQALQQRIEKSGEAWFATTVLHGRRAMRININSFLTERRHVDELIQLLKREGGKLIEEGFVQ
jgi:glutamate/tyrosine decarboxylase-like PLP-dependent enzyme